MDYTQVILAPVSTEKSVRAATEGQYTFYVTQRANKIEVSKAIESLYGVRPLKVSMTILPSKTTSQGKVKRAVRRKATVVLPKGKTIDPLKIK